MQPRTSSGRSWAQEYAVALDRRHAQDGVRTLALSQDRAIDAARAGDSAAFSALIQQHHATALRLAERIMASDAAAADAVQDALIKAHKAIRRFQDGNFRSWLLRIVTNTCYDHLRRLKRHNLLSLDALTDEMSGEPFLQLESHRFGPADDPEHLAILSESMASLLNAIDDLPAWHRNVILLVDVHGYDYGEAAGLLRVPLGTVKSRLSRARAALRDQLVSRGVVGSANLQ